jgi:hypothetical protein
MIGRLLVDGEADLPAVHALQDAIALKQLDGRWPRLHSTLRCNPRSIWATRDALRRW